MIGPQAPPLAQDDTAETKEDSSVTIDVLANDSDPEGDVLVVTAVGDGAALVLASLPALERARLWEAGLTPAALEGLRAERSELELDAGGDAPEQPNCFADLIGDYLDLAPLAPVDTPEDTTAAIVFTSGTTGLPKAAVHTHGNWLWAATMGPMTASVSIWR